MYFIYDIIYIFPIGTGALLLVMSHTLLSVLHQTVLQLLYQSVAFQDEARI